MTSNNNNDIFTYSYSSQEQEEIRRIREKYTPGDAKEDKLEKLRRLDESVTTKSTVFSLIMGIIGALILGLGMSLFLTDLGVGLGFAAYPLGIGVGIIGLACVLAAYPIYVYVTKRERERIAPEILRLTDDLMK